MTEEIAFTVTEDKETQRIEMKDMPILKDIRVVKVDSKTKEIIKDKFTFGLYEDSECTKLIKEVKANKEDGFVTFEDLRYGTVYNAIFTTYSPIFSSQIFLLPFSSLGAIKRGPFFLFFIKYYFTAML